MKAGRSANLWMLNLKFETFKGLVSLSMEDLCRELFLGNRESIKIKKEGVAVKNLVKIFEAALTLSNEKGFAAMSLRDLSAKAGLSMGALYTYFSSKEELLQMIQRQISVVIQVLLEQIEGIEDPRVKLNRVIQIPPLSQRGHAAVVLLCLHGDQEPCKTGAQKGHRGRTCYGKTSHRHHEGRQGQGGLQGRQYGAYRRSNQGHASGLVPQDDGSMPDGKYQWRSMPHLSWTLLRHTLQCLNSKEKELAIWILRTNPQR